jgi:alkaline phosphatase
VDPNRDLIADFQTAGFYYAPNLAGLSSMTGSETKLLGLFNSGHMDVSMDKIAYRRTSTAAAGSLISTFPNQPLLEEMTDKALSVLSKNANGFVMMIEAASVDKQAHNMDTERWVHDAIELDRAVAKCIAFQASNPDTLIIVTADHECAGINIIGGSLVTNSSLVNRAASGGGAAQLRTPVVGTYDNAKFPAYTNAADGYPTTMDVDYRMLIGYAGNSDRYEDWLTNPTYNQDPIARDTAGNFLVTGQQPGAGVQSAVHTASDIPLSAGGRGAAAFTGVFDNTEAFFKAMQAAIGGAK